MVKKIRLKQPIKNGSETIEELVFQEPRAKHFRKMPVGNLSLGDYLDVASKLCGQPTHVFDEMGVEDMAQVVELMGELEAGGQGTGGPPSAS